MITKELFLLAASVLGLTCGQTQPVPCEDVDTNSCQTFANANPSICSDAVFAQSMCKRFCGNCPLRCYSCTAVSNPADCRTTETCGPNMKCMLKTFLAPDGRHAHIMACEQAAVCNSLTDGFNGIFGKRENRRDLVLSCCDGDLCNLPKTAVTTVTTTPRWFTTTTPKWFTTTTPGWLTTTTPRWLTTTALLTTTTTRAAMTPTPIPVTGGTCYRDIVIVLDASGSVGATNFQTMMDFVSQLLQEVPIGPNHARVALMTFDSKPYIQWNLSSYTTYVDIHDALMKVRYTRGTTHTAEALELVATSLLTPGAGDRPTAPNAVLVVTDGQSNNPASTASRAQHLHAVATDVVAIGVGSGVHRTELDAIATDQQHVFNAHSFNDLHPLIAGVKQHLCS